MKKINLKLKQNISLLALVPFVLFSIVFFIFAFRINNLPTTSSEPQKITFSNDIPGTDLKLYRNKKYGFSLIYPKKYDYREVLDASTVIFYLVGDPNKGTSNSIIISANETPREYRGLPFRNYASVAGLGIQYYDSLYSIDKFTTDFGAVGYRAVWTIVWDRYPPNVQKYQSLPFAYFELVNTDNKFLEARFAPAELEKDFDLMISTLSVNNVD